MTLRMMSGWMAALALAALAGCGTTQIVSDPARVNVKVVAIESVPLPRDRFFYLGPGDGTGLMFGAIGGAASAGRIQDSRTAFLAFIDSKGVSLERIAREEVSAAVERSGKLKTGTGGGTLRITFQQYGFGVPHLGSSYVVPVMTYQCEILDPAGKVVWAASERLSTLGNPVEPVKPEAMRDDPALIEKTWRAAARHIATNVLATF